MAQGTFGSAFSSFSSKPGHTAPESEEPVEQVDAFEDEDGYEEDNEVADEYDDEGYDYEDDQYQEDDDDSLDSRDSVKTLKKRLDDKDSYINELKSNLDSTNHQMSQIQQQLNYLISNQSNQQPAEDDTFDVDVDFDPEEYGNFGDFEKVQQKKDKLNKLKSDAKDGRQVRQYLENRQRAELNYVNSQADYKEMNQRYQDMIKSGEDSQILNHLQGQPLALYYYLKSKTFEKQKGVKAEKIKERYDVPKTNVGKSGGAKRNGRQGGRSDMPSLKDGLSSNLNAQIKSNKGLPAFSKN